MLRSPQKIAARRNDRSISYYQREPNIKQILGGETIEIKTKESVSYSYLISNIMNRMPSERRVDKLTENS